VLNFGEVIAGDRLQEAILMLHRTRDTIRLKLLKIGALARVSVRRIKVAMTSACPAATPGAALPPVSPPPKLAPRPPDTRRRTA
jgi:hypothetical protein